MCPHLFLLQSRHHTTSERLLIFQHMRSLTHYPDRIHNRTTMMIYARFRFLTNQDALLAGTLHHAQLRVRALRHHAQVTSLWGVGKGEESLTPPKCQLLLGEQVSMRGSRTHQDSRI